MTVLSSQIKSTGLTLEQMAEHAEVPVEKLTRACTGEIYLQGDEAERVEAMVWAARVLLSMAKAESAGVEWNRKQAELEAFKQGLIDAQARVVELQNDNDVQEATSFNKWVREQELKFGIVITDLDAAYSIFKSVQQEWFESADGQAALKKAELA